MADGVVRGAKRKRITFGAVEVISIPCARALPPSPAPVEAEVEGGGRSRAGFSTRAAALAPSFSFSPPSPSPSPLLLGEGADEDASFPPVERPPHFRRRAPDVGAEEGLTQVLLDLEDRLGPFWRFDSSKIADEIAVEEASFEMPIRADENVVHAMKANPHAEGPLTIQDDDENNGERLPPWKVSRAETAHPVDAERPSSKMIATTAPFPSSPSSSARRCIFCKKTILAVQDNNHNDDDDDDGNNPNPLNAFSREQQGNAFHVICALWCPEVYYDVEKEEFVNVNAAIERTKDVKCAHCCKGGASIGCINTDCPLSYHLHCALYLHLPMDKKNFQLSCLEHRKDAKRCEAKEESLIA